MKFKLARMIAWREKGASGFKILALALGVSIFSVTLIFNLILATKILLYRDASKLLGADLILESSAPLPPLSLILANDLGLHSAHVIDFFSMVVADQKMELATLSAIKGDYPLRGELRIDNDKEIVAKVGAPNPGEMWVEEGLLHRLDRKLHDSVQVGEEHLIITGIIRDRPVATSDISAFAPIAYINERSLDQMKVLQPGSRATYRLLLSGTASQLANYTAIVKVKLSADVKWITPGTGRSSVSHTLKIVERYLSIILLIEIILAGLVIAITAHQHSLSLQHEVALWRCLGATHRQILLSHILGYLMLALFVIVLSVLLAYGATYEIAHYAKKWSDYDLPIRAEGAWVGLGMGCLLLGGFGLPPLLALKQITPQSILQRVAQSKLSINIKWYVGTVVLLCLLFAGGIQDTDIAIQFSVAMMIMGAMAFGVIWMMWYGFSLANRQGPLAWRLAVSHLIRYRTAIVVQCVVFTVVITFLLLVHIFQSDFLKNWQTQLPASTPNYFLINVQPGDVTDMRKWLESEGIRQVQFYPVVRGRLTHINQHSVDVPAATGKPVGLERPINLTWMKILPADNRILAGSDWSDVKPGSMSISVEKGFADRQGVTLGDTFTFDIGGETISAKIVQLRTVEWSSFRPNFFVIFPPGLLDKFGHSYISSLYLAPSEKAILLKLIQRSPEISIIDIDVLLDKVRVFTSKLALILTLLLGLVGALGVMIMYASVLSTLQERIHESALLRVLGAKTALIQKVFLIEFAVLGAISGLLGSLMAMALAYYLGKQFFEVTLVLQTKWIAMGVIGSVILISIFGMVGVSSVFRASPLRLFRQLT